jgi:hypothetical protein
MLKTPFKRGREIDKIRVLKADSYDEYQDKMIARLNRKYSKSKVEWVLQIQALFEALTDETYAELFKRLRFTIEGKAKAKEKRFKNVWLSYHDFEEQLWKATYDALDYYEQVWGDTEFSLLETLELYWKKRLTSFIKSTLYTQKHSPWYNASKLAEGFEEFWADESPNPEQGYIYKETVNDMLNDRELNEKERMLLAEIYDFPSGSLRDWGNEIGISHPQSVKRIYKQLKRKLDKYRIE